ncbi:hypothetical protein [Clostridium sp. UBA1056]|uniref:hypothetical protein n=1 Tax=Clostridium sp. UBA1056 TaxID=1946346 RepID=UPI0032178224
MPNLCLWIVILILIYSTDCILVVKILKKNNYRGKIKIRFFGLGIEIKIKEKSASSVQD